MRKYIRTTRYVCERCGHEWAARQRGRTPRICPNCKTELWAVPCEPGKVGRPRKHLSEAARLRLSEQRE